MSEEAIHPPTATVKSPLPPVDKIDADTAEREFKRFTDAMEIDLDTEGLDDNDRRDNEISKRTIIKNIRSGDLIINDRDLPEYTPKRSDRTEAIVFKEPTGAMLMAIDKKKDTAKVAQIHALLGSMTGNHENVFAKMAQSDVKVCSEILMTFLA